MAGGVWAGLSGERTFSGGGANYARENGPKETKMMAPANGRTCARRALWWCLAAGAAHAGAPCTQHPLPSIPVSAEMATVLANGRLTLREAVLFQQAGHGSCPAVATVIPGLARMCEHPEIAEYTIRPCAEGTTSLTIVMQSYDDRSLAGSAALGIRRQSNFDVCLARLREAAAGTQCRLAIVRQWFHATDTRGPCPQARGLAAGLSARMVRVMTQTLAAGRAYEWALAHHPGAGSFVRARLDSAWCAPQGAVARGTSVLVLNQYVVEGNQNGVRWAGDIFAFMTKDVAPRYFEAWRIWRTINCSALCMAGSGTSACSFVGLARACTGETPLTAWLCTQHGGLNHSSSRPQWWRMERMPYPIVEGQNGTGLVHTRMGKTMTAEALVRKLDARRAATCPACMPHCLPGGKVMRARKRFKGRSSSCTADYQSLGCLFRAQQRDYWRREGPSEGD